MDLNEFHEKTIGSKDKFLNKQAHETIIPPELRGLQSRARLLSRGIGEMTAKVILIAVAQKWAEDEREKLHIDNG